MELEFREMKPNEAEIISEMTLEAFNTYYSNYSPDDLKREANALTHEINQLNLLQVSKYYVLIEDNKLVGSAALTIYNDHCYLNSMVINPKLQKNGYGTALLNYILDQTSEKKYDNIYLYANNAGEKLYLKNGFKSSLIVTPLKLKYIKPVKIEYDKIEFNFEIPSWIEDIEIERYGLSRLKLYDYLFSQETDLLSIGEKAFCTLRGQTIGNVYAETPDYAVALIHEAWKLGGEYFNAFQNQIFDSIKKSISFRPLNDLSCTRMYLKEELGNFHNFYGILSFGFG